MYTEIILNTRKSEFVSNKSSVMSLCFNSLTMFVVHKKVSLIYINQGDLFILQKHLINIALSPHLFRDIKDKQAHNINLNSTKLLCETNRNQAIVPDICSLPSA